MAILALALVAAGCGETKEVLSRLDPFEVKTEVFKPCVVELDINKYDPATVVYADNSAAILAAPDVDAQTKLRLAGIAQRDANLLDLFTGLKGCMTAPK